MIKKPPLNKALAWILDNVKDVVQTKVAVAVGVKQSYISNLKTGKKKGPVDTWQKIVAHIGVPYEVFFEFGESLPEIIPQLDRKIQKKDLKKELAEWLLRHRKKQDLLQSFKNQAANDELFAEVHSLTKHQDKKVAKTAAAVIEKFWGDNQEVAPPIPIDPAVELLNECIEETGANLNRKQKEAVVKVIRNHQNQAKKEVNDILQAFG